MKFKNYFFKTLQTVALMIVIIHHVPVRAGDSNLTLDGAISESEQKNPDLQKLKARVDRISWTKFEAMSSYMPHVSAGYDHYFTDSYMREDVLLNGAAINFPEGIPQDYATIDISLTVFDGFKGINDYAAADLNTEAAKLDLKRMQFEVDQKVRTAFFNALAAQKFLEVAQANVKTLQDHLSQAQLTQKTGYTTGFDVLRIQATIEEANAEGLEASNNVELTREALGYAMGLETPDTRTLIGELPVLNNNIVPLELKPDVKKRDDLQAQIKRNEATLKESSASKSFWLPSVSLFAEEQYYKFGNFDPAILSSPGYQNASNFGLRVRWNLFDGGLSLAREQQAAAALMESQSDLHKSYALLPVELDNWKKKFSYSVSLYQARVRALAQFQESVRLAKIGVRAGVRTNTEMLDAELDLIRARTGVVHAQTDAVEALGKLELASGQRLWTP